LFVAGAVASFVLFVVWLFYSTVNAQPEYEFMNGARQTGFAVREVSGRTVRFYVIDRKAADVALDARLETKRTLTWARRFNADWFSYGGRDHGFKIDVLPGDPDKTIVEVANYSTRMERYVGKLYRSVPSYASRVR
jgi:hypothetical protein